MTTRLTQAQETEFRALFERGYSCRRLASHFGKHPQWAYRRLKMLGLTPRTKSEAGTLRWARDTKYRMNDAFLSRWSHDLAWFLGLMFTDGHIWKDHTRAALTSKDIDFLKQVRALLGSNFRIETRSTTPQLVINSTARARKLEGYGLTPKKSLSIKFPDVPEEFLSHFIRGVLDGDGSISTSDKGKYIMVSFCSASQDFILEMETRISQALGLSANPKQRDRQSARTDRFGPHIHPEYSIAYYGKKASALLDWLYAGSRPQTRLARKFKRYLSLCRPTK